MAPFALQKGPFFIAKRTLLPSKTNPFEGQKDYIFLKTNY